MRYLIMVLVVEALVSVAGATGGVTEDAGMDLQQDGTPSSELEIIEVFRAETPEELEATLSDGYPPAWLEEILTDESIPEEDRYWLDCRVRAVIAQDLHLFFSEEGRQVRYEAGYIVPGEEYWRECFIVNLPGNEPADNPPEGQWAGRGLLVDRFGNEIGEIAISNSFSQISRDGSVGVTQSGIQGSNFGPGLMNLCFFYPGGTFREFPVHHNRINETVSQSGELVVASCEDRSRSEEKVNKLYVFDADANLLWERTLEYPSPGQRPAISPDDRYIAVQTHRHGGANPVILFDATTGDELRRWDLMIGNFLHFSPDSRYLCISSGQAGIVVDCVSGEVIWSRFLNDAESDPSIELVEQLYCTTDAEFIYWLASNTHNDFWTMLSTNGDTEVFDNHYFGIPGISPDGYIYVAQTYRVSSTSLLPTPIHVIMLKWSE